MSRLLGTPIHLCVVHPDFDAALARYAAGGIGPFYVMHSNGQGRYRGELSPHNISVAFFYSGDTCIEVITPNGPQQNAYAEFLARNPAGGLHHVAYYSADFAATLAMMEAAGKPLRVVQEFFSAETGMTFEIYCEPVGQDNPVLFQLLRPGLFDPWFDAMKAAAADWDGTELMRDAQALMQSALSAHAAQASA